MASGYATTNYLYIVIIMLNKSLKRLSKDLKNYNILTTAWKKALNI